MFRASQKSGFRSRGRRFPATAIRQLISFIQVIFRASPELGMPLQVDENLPFPGSLVAPSTFLVPAEANHEFFAVRYCTALRNTASAGPSMLATRHDSSCDTRSHGVRPSHLGGSVPDALPLQCPEVSCKIPLAGIRVVPCVLMAALLTTPEGHSMCRTSLDSPCERNLL